MRNANTFTPPELDAIIRNLPKERGPFPKPKKWNRVDVGPTEVYVGDRLYIVALVEKSACSADDVAKNQTNTEDVVIRYLKSEGFIDSEYAYVGMQRFNIKKPPTGFTNDDEGGLPPDM